MRVATPPALKRFYFSAFEHRKPPSAVPYSPLREFVWQIFASTTIALGAWYLHWRWTASLNFDAMVFSVLVALAETMAWIGMLLYFHNLWAVKDTPHPKRISAKRLQATTEGKGQIVVDIFIPTVNEDPELVRYSVRAAYDAKCPAGIVKKIHVLDDGDRLAMRAVAQQEGANYITRTDRIGYKAGNLRNGLAETSGDFLVILDADTRMFPNFLTHVLGYFEDPDVAWVQTPQWFFDLPEGIGMDRLARRHFGWVGRVLSFVLKPVLGQKRIFQDPFCNDPSLFYDAIQRRRNRDFASFCCGAGSVHRRSAVMFRSLLDYSDQIDAHLSGLVKFKKSSDQQKLRPKLRAPIAHKAELMPYKFHVSEDLYTSIKLHGAPERRWKSIYHPEVLTKMLSPQDLSAWATQRFKYAAGTLDILKRDNPLLRSGLNWRQRLHYATTFYSYLSPIWMSVFILAPIISLVTGWTPVRAYSSEFFQHLLPFLLMHEVATVAGLWGFQTMRAKLFNIAFFSFNLQALWAVILGREIKFKVTPKIRASGNYLALVRPQIVVIVLTLIALTIAAFRTMSDPSPEATGIFIVNGFWAFMNCLAMSVLIGAALWTPKLCEIGSRHYD